MKINKGTMNMYCLPVLHIVYNVQQYICIIIYGKKNNN